MVLTSPPKDFGKSARAIVSFVLDQISHHCSHRWNLTLSPGGIKTRLALVGRRILSCILNLQTAVDPSPLMRWTTMLEAKQLQTSVDGANGSFVYPRGTHVHFSVLMTSCHIADLEFAPEQAQRATRSVWTS
jgi:hypothetical protein